MAGKEVSKGVRAIYAENSVRADWDPFGRGRV